MERTRQHELFAAAVITPGGPQSFDEERSNQQRAAMERLSTLLQSKREVPYPASARHVARDAARLGVGREAVIGLRSAGDLDVWGLEPRERTPKKGHVLVRKGAG